MRHRVRRERVRCLSTALPEVSGRAARTPVLNDSMRPKMDARELAKLVRRGESAVLEFKREWWDFDNKVGKATFAKDILAMANSLNEGDVGHIVVGVEDKKAGGAVIGVNKTPSSDTVAQVL